MTLFGHTCLSNLCKGITRYFSSLQKQLVDYTLLNQKITFYFLASRIFGHIQIDRVKEMKKVARNFQDDTIEENLSGVKLSIVAANNHYVSKVQTTINIFRQLLGLEVKNRG
jgi:hypothetical protein